MDKLLWDNLYTIPLYQKPTFLAYNSNYTGLEENASLRRPAVGLDEDRAEAVAAPAGSGNPVASRG